MHTGSDERTAWSAAASLNAALLAANAVELFAFPAPLGSWLTRLRLLELVLCGTWLLVLFRWRSTRPLRLSLAAFASAPLPLLFLWSTLATEHEAMGAVFEPLLRERAAMLIIAVLTPRQAWVTYVLIGAFVVESLAEYLIPSVGATVNFRPAEPWITFGAAILAAWIARSRARLLTRERTLARELREARDAARLAEMALAVRDLANTPLQVIELQVALLETRHHPAPPEVGRIRRALRRLSELNHLLAAFHRPDDGRSLESFDAAELLLHLRRRP
jgi:hypothetical protein